MTEAIERNVGELANGPNLKVNGETEKNTEEFQNIAGKIEKAIGEQNNQDEIWK